MEMKAMQGLGHHPNIVRLYCTSRIEGRMLSHHGKNGRRPGLHFGGQEIANALRFHLWKRLS